METLTLTKQDFDSDNNYIGNTDLSDFQGHLEIVKDLGLLKFKYLKISGVIHAEAGSGIKAGWGIEAGEGIEAGHGYFAEGKKRSSKPRYLGTKRNTDT